MKYKRVSDKYFTVQGSGGWREVQGKPWKSELLPDYDFFVSKSTESSVRRMPWGVSEGTSGRLVSTSCPTRKEAIESAIQRIERYLERLPDTVENAIKASGLSPRYEKEEV